MEGRHKVILMSKQKKSSFQKTGFSLIEILASISIFAVLIGMASISFLHLSPKYRLVKAVREIHSRMNYARYRAIYKGTRVRIRLDADGYTIETYNSKSSSWTHSPKVFLEGVDIEANNSPTFHPIGTVSNLASIYVSNSWGKYKISLAITGRIKVTFLAYLSNTTLPSIMVYTASVLRISISGISNRFRSKTVMSANFPTSSDPLISSSKTA